MLKAVIRPQARNDIKEIWRYIYLNWGEKQADNYAYAIGQAINEMPDIGNNIYNIRKGYRLQVISLQAPSYYLSSDINCN